MGSLVLIVLGAFAPTPPSNLDLALHPSTLAEAVTPAAEALNLALPKPAPALRGQYCGPIYLDGVYAQQLKHLPSSMREGMARPLGPTFLVVETPNVGTTGGGAGLYGRF